MGAKLARRSGRRAPRFTPSALSRLRAHDWPGNVRELEAVVARAMLSSDGGPVSADDVDLPPRCGQVAAGDGLEARMIEAALRETDGVASRAAADIGWTRQKLARRMAVLGIARTGS
jgi:DNA-binding NtrC family response regulator